MLWGNEGTLSAEHIKAWLQLKSIEGKERVKPLKLWRPQKEGTHSQHQITKPTIIVWPSRSIF